VGIVEKSAFEVKGLSDKYSGVIELQNPKE
jgi:hypothetical protein